MSRYIDADKLVERMKASPVFPNMGEDGYFLLDCVCDLIERQPTVDVQDVNHGKWIVKDLTPYCSICHRPSEYECDGVHSKPLFCANCGAKMDEKEK